MANQDNLRNTKECSMRFPVGVVEGEGTLSLPMNAPLPKRKFREMSCYSSENQK